MNNVQTQMAGFNSGAPFSANQHMNSYMMPNMNQHYPQGAMGGYQQPIQQQNQNGLYNQMNYAGAGVPPQNTL